MTELPPEIRRCSGCGQTAVLAGVAWQHFYWGVKTGTSTRELRCQACGRQYVLRPRTQLIGTIIAGVLLLPTCMGIPILALAGWWWAQDGRNPVVPGAPPVTRRFRDGPPRRRCGACGQIAVATAVTRKRHNGIPTGTEYTYGCPACQASFIVESPWGHLFALLMAAVVGAAAIAFAALGTTLAWRLGGAAVCSVIDLGILAQGACGCCDGCRTRPWRTTWSAEPRSPAIVAGPAAPLAQGTAMLGSPEETPCTGCAL